MRAWRSATRSRANRNHQGPKTTTVAAITSSAPSSGRSVEGLRTALVENEHSQAEQRHAGGQAHEEGRPGAFRPGVDLEQATGSATQPRSFVVFGVAVDEDQAGRADHERRHEGGQEADAQDRQHDEEEHQHRHERQHERESAPVGYGARRDRLG